MIDHIEGRSIRRTGWRIAARRCPTHAEPLELCLDELPNLHDHNRIRWRCDVCVGSWIENYFQDVPPRRREALLLRCPRCGGRARHACMPACCHLHDCMDCGARLQLYATPRSAGIEAPWRVWEPWPNGPIELVASGLTVDFRWCPKHATPQELVFVGRIPEEPACDLAWRCPTCGRLQRESEVRGRRRYFVPDAVAGLDCPHCHEHGGVVNPEGVPTCTLCRATFDLELVLRA